MRAGHLRYSKEMYKNTVVEVIARKHQSLLNSLDKLIRQEHSRHRFEAIKRYLTSLSATNLAEELTLYSELDWSDDIDIDDFRAFQMLLDNLAENIYFCGSRNQSLGNELNLLRYLASIHYRNEARTLLKLAEWKLTLSESRNLAKEFQATYHATRKSLAGN